VLLRSVRFGGAKDAYDYDNWSRYREVFFQVHGIDAQGKVIIRLQLKHRYVLAFFQKLPPCLVGIELAAGLCKALWNARRAVTMSDQKRGSPKRNNKQQRPAKHRDQHGDV
jgi:hypothetical protein